MFWKCLKKPDVGKKNLINDYMLIYILNPAPPKILKNLCVLAWSVAMEIEHGQKILLHFCSGAKMRAKIQNTPRIGAKMDTSGLGYICIIYPQPGRRIFATSEIAFHNLCTVFAPFLLSCISFLLDFCLQKI